MKSRKPKSKKAKPAPSIVVDGVSHKIPKHLFDLPDGQLAKVIRGYRPEEEAQKTDLLMTPIEFLAAIEKLGLSQERAGVFLGFSARTGQRFALGEKEIPIAVVYLLGEMLRNKVTPEEIASRYAKK